MDPIEPSALAAGGPVKGSHEANDNKQRSSIDRTKPLSASQALANVLGLHVRLHRLESSSDDDRNGPTAEVVTTVTTPDEGGCQHEWTLRLGARWGLLEAWCPKCGEVAVRRAA
jgi:hypothetical protein